MAAASTEARTGHGWWPYIVPYMSFLGIVEVANRTPSELALLMLVLKPVVPLGLMIYFWRRGEYPELRGERLGLMGALSDVAMGAGLALLWMFPYLYFESLRPDASTAFDPAQLGEQWIHVTLGLRMFGYALVTPLFEELFIRSFVMRYADVYGGDGDFRDIPLARYTLRSFITTIVVFTIGHVPWEWWVAVPWVAATNLWFYHRRSLSSVILVHATTNACLLILAIYGSGSLRGADGAPLSLWFFI